MTYESDEEQIEALKNWWNENGKSLLIGVAIALAVLFATRQWQSSDVATAEAASVLYQEMAEIVLDNNGQILTEDDFNVASGYNNQLRSEYGNNIYSKYSALMMARVLVEQNDLALAAEELQWILDNRDIGLLDSAEDELFLTARLRLARVTLAEGQAQEAINILLAVDSGSYEGSYAEVQGDAHILLGQIGDARAAYQLALQSADNPNLLRLKLEDLGE